MLRRRTERRTALLCLILVLIPSAIARGQQPQLQNQIRTAFAFEQITVAAASIPFTSATYAPVVTGVPSFQSRAEVAMFSCETAQIRYRADGTAPTSTVGTIINVGDVITVFGFNNIKQFAMIRTGATSALCSVHYFRVTSNAP